VDTSAFGMQFIKRPRTELDETDEQKPHTKNEMVRACYSNLAHCPGWTGEQCIGGSREETN
jgi:hypothetical protein